MLMINICAKSNSLDVIRRAYVDGIKNVHIVFNDGHDIKITKIRRMANVTLSPDKRTVAWLVLNTWIAEGDTVPQSGKLAIYKNGKTRYIECGPFIRDYWFWMQGRQIATDCGGMHFAGTLTLYDIDTLRDIASFYQPDIPEDKQPAWSKSSSNSDSDTTH